MSWKKKAADLLTRFGPSVKFAAKLVVGALPGGAAVVDLVGQALDCAYETAKDNLEPNATSADMNRLEEMLGLLNGDLAGLTDRLRKLENQPDQAERMLDSAKTSDAGWQMALDKLARRNEELHGETHAMLKELLQQTGPEPSVRRAIRQDTAGQARELRTRGPAPAGLREKLAAVVAAWNAAAEPESQTEDVKDYYCQIRVPGWGQKIHYEFTQKGD